MSMSMEALTAILSIDLSKYILHELLELPGISGTQEFPGRLDSLTGSFGIFVITDDRRPFPYSSDPLIGVSHMQRIAVFTGRHGCRPGVTQLQSLDLGLQVGTGGSAPEWRFIK
jgi:hypothetical protein